MKRKKEEVREQEIKGEEKKKERVRIRGRAEKREYQERRKDVGGVRAQNNKNQDRAVGETIAGR